MRPGSSPGLFTSGFQPHIFAPVRLCLRSCRAVPDDIVSTSSAVGHIGLFDAHRSVVVAHPASKLITDIIISHHVYRTSWTCQSL